MGKLGKWLQVGANVGILAGLILVALQIQQNSELGRLYLANIKRLGATLIGRSKARNFP